MWLHRKPCKGDASCKLCQLTSMLMQARESVLNVVEDFLGLCGRVRCYLLAICCMRVITSVLFKVSQVIDFCRSPSV